MNRLRFIFPFLASFALMACVHQQAGRGTGQLVQSQQSATQAQSDEPSSSIVSKVNMLSPDHPVINVYMENSGSMYGYVDLKQKSMFQQSVYSFLVDVKNSGLPSSFNLYFINSKVIDKGTDIDAFINKITASSFSTSGGNGTRTDIAEMLKDVLSRTSNDTVSIFISDCIFSPGKVNSPEAYLESQKTSLRNSFSEYLDRNPQSAVSVYQIYSPFKGKYYDFQDKPRIYEGERPYYIFVIGNTKFVLDLKLAVGFKSFIPEANNYWAIFNFPFDVLKPYLYSLQMGPKKGSFSRKSPKVMSKARNDANGDFMFTLASDMSLYEGILESDYMMDVKNYARLINKVDSKDFFMDIERDENPASPLTLRYEITTQQRMPVGVFSLVLLRNAPQWAYDMTDLDDRSFNSGNERKTYGLKYIFDGITSAFTGKCGSFYTSMNIDVEK